MVTLTALLFGLQAQAYTPGSWDSAYANPTFDPKHAMDVGPGDNIDLFSGALNLASTDVDIPGAYGLGMTLTRGYSSKVVDENLSPIDTGWAGLGWTMVPGGRIFFDWWLDSLYGGTYFIRVDLPGKGQQVAFLLDPADPVYRDAADSHAFPDMDASYTSLYVTEDFTFVYPVSGSEYRAITTEGLLYSFDLSAGTHADSWYYGDSVQNEHGDIVQFSYDSCAATDNAGALDMMWDGLGRAIRFGVDGRCFLTSASWRTTSGMGTVYYSVDVDGLLSSVQTTGETTNYVYTGDYDELTSVFLPTGGWVDYSYSTVSVLADYDVVWGEDVLEIRVVDARTLHDGTGSTWAWSYEFDDYYVGHSTYGVITSDSDYRVTRVNQPDGGVVDHYYGSFCYTEIGGVVRSACTSDWLGLPLQTVWYESTGSTTPTRWTYTDWTDSGASSYNMNRVLLSSAVAYNPYQNWDYGASKPVPTYVLEYEDRAVGSSEYKLWSWYGESSAGDYDQYGNLASSYDAFYQPYYSTSSSARYYGLEKQWTWAWDTEPVLEGWNLVRLVGEEEIGQGQGTGTLASTHSHTATTYSTSTGEVGWVAKIEHDAQGSADYDGDGSTDDNPSADESVTYTYSFPGTGELRVEADIGGLRTRRIDYERGAQSGVSWSDGAGGWTTEFSATVNPNSGLVTAVTDAAGHTTQFRYDDQGRLTRTEPPVGADRVFSYGLNSSPPTITETIAGATSTYTYDGLGRLASVETPNGTGVTATVEQDHDGFDRVSRAYVPYASTSAGWTDTSYDVLGRVTHIEQDDGAGVSLDTEIDYAWPSVERTDAVGQITDTVVDGYGAAGLVTPPDGVVLEALAVGSSTLTGQLVDVIDSTGATSLQQLTYTDQAGRPWYFSDWQSGGRVFMRDAAGDVTCEWDDNGDYTVRDFDEQGRPESVTHGGDCAPVAAPTFAWTYDGEAVPGLTGFTYSGAQGRLSTAQDEAGYEEFAYDAGGRVVGTRRTGADLAAGLQVALSQAYDSAGNVEDQSLDFNGSSWQILSTHGPGNRVESIRVLVTDSAGSTQTLRILTDATYHPGGAPQTFTYANGVSESVDLDAYGRPDHVYTTGATDDLDLVYTFYANGHVESITDADGTDTYTQDALGRLTSVAYGDDSTAVSYTYDEAGNMTDRAGDYTDTFSGLAYTYNRRDDWSWDSAGNLTSDGSTAFTWTPEGQVRSAGDSSTLFLMGYDGSGRRVVEREVSPSGTSEGTFELYDPQGQLRATFVSLGTTWQLNELYVHAAGRPVAVLSGGSSGELRWLHQDISGSTRMLTNRGGATVGTREFLPYGAERTASGTIAGTAFSYAGHEEFNDLGVADFGSRSLHEGLPRFLSPDRVALGVLADAQSFNRYAYGANNPVSYADPSGDIPIPLVVYGVMKAVDAALVAHDLYKVHKGEMSAKQFAVEAAVGFVAGKALQAAAGAVVGVGALAVRHAVKKRGARAGDILFGQKGVSRTFTSAERGSTFDFAGQPISKVAEGLRTGGIDPDQLPIQYIVRDGQRITLNNRSLTALRQAGLSPTRTIDVTGDAVLEARLTTRLAEMGGAPADVIRVRGGPVGTSAIR